MTKRISYIDNTRAILIALVVLGHILNYANPKYDIVPYVLVQQFLDSFHMPAFFILSGMLTDGDKWRRFALHCTSVHAGRTCSDIDLPRRTRLCIHAGGQFAE